MNEIDIDNIIEDITNLEFKEIYMESERYLKKYLKLSDDLVNLIIQNSKIINWPIKFNTKKKIKENLKDFEKLICKLIIVMSYNFHFFLYFNILY